MPNLTPSLRSTSDSLASLDNNPESDESSGVSLYHDDPNIEMMRAMVIEEIGKPLLLKTVPIPIPNPDQVLIQIIACGICRTDLHILDGELSDAKLPLIPGHEIIGIIKKAGSNVSELKEGQVVGVPWLAHTCGACKYCTRGQENLCENALFTGYTMDGGYAEYTVAYEQFCFPMDPIYSNAAGAPLLCAGLIGFRSYSMLDKDAEKIGIYGFGAAAHILIQIAIHQGKKIYAFTRKGDQSGKEFAIKCGAVWAGDSSQSAPEKLDGAIIFAPTGTLVPKALMDIDKGASVICGGIHMDYIPSFSYDLLWGERSIRSVANLTRLDGEKFMKLAPLIPIKTTTTTFYLDQANEALESLRAGHINGAAVLLMNPKPNHNE